MVLGLLRRHVHRFLVPHRRRGGLGARSEGAEQRGGARRPVFCPRRDRDAGHVEAVLEYPDMLLTFSFRPTPLPGFEHMGHIGCVFEGTKASLVTNYTAHEVWVAGKKAVDFPIRLRPFPTRLGTFASSSTRSSPESGNHVQRPLRSSGHETRTAVEHRVSYRPADSLERRARAHRRRQRREQVLRSGTCVVRLHRRASGSDESG